MVAAVKAAGTGSARRPLAAMGHVTPVVGASADCNEGDAGRRLTRWQQCHGQGNHRAGLTSSSRS